MYQAFYGLNRAPFSKDIPIEQLFLSKDYKQFMSRMEYFKTVKGFALTYGRPGMGKTTCLRSMTSKLNPQMFKIVYLALSSVTIIEFYRNLTIGLGLQPRQKKVDMYHQIQDHIINLQHQKRLTPFVIIDEAQLLSSAIFNELRMLFNFQMDSKNHAMVLLCGQTSLMNQINLYIHEPLRQRIVVHHEFQGIEVDEVQEFITTMLKAAGLSDPLFTPDGISALANVCNGNPRLLCTVSEKALLVGMLKKTNQLDATIVQDAYESTAIYDSGGIRL